MRTKARRGRKKEEKMTEKCKTEGKIEGEDLHLNDVYFNVDKMSVTKTQFVFFVDIMGMKATMLRSFAKSTIFMGKMHCAIRGLQNGNSSIKVYPVMDGAYIVSNDLEKMIEFIRNLFTRLGKVFVSTEKIEDCFLVRGCLSFGPVIGGDEINDKVNKQLAEDAAYKSKLLFGFPMILAFNGEVKAPPFGVYLDTTVRVAENRKLSGIWYRWCKDEVLKKGIIKGLSNYFQWAKNSSLELTYDEERMAYHEKMANQYWH